MLVLIENNYKYSFSFCRKPQLQFFFRPNIWKLIPACFLNDTVGEKSSEPNFVSVWNALYFTCALKLMSKLVVPLWLVFLLYARVLVLGRDIQINTDCILSECPVWLHKQPRSGRQKGWHNFDRWILSYGLQMAHNSHELGENRRKTGKSGRGIERRGEAVQGRVREYRERGFRDVEKRTIKTSIEGREPWGNVIPCSEWPMIFHVKSFKHRNQVVCAVEIKLRTFEVIGCWHLIKKIFILEYFVPGFKVSRKRLYTNANLSRLS